MLSTSGWATLLFGMGGTNPEEEADSRPTPPSLLSYPTINRNQHSLSMAKVLIRYFQSGGGLADGTILLVGRLSPSPSGWRGRAVKRSCSSPTVVNT